jgi:hypothetical protein
MHVLEGVSARCRLLIEMAMKHSVSISLALLTMLQAGILPPAALFQAAGVLAGLFALDKETRRERAERMHPREEEEPPYWEQPPWLVSLVQLSFQDMQAGWP